MDLVWFESDRGHQVSRLDGLRVDDPTGQIAGCVRRGVGADRAPTAEVAEVGTECPGGFGAADAVAPGARCPHERRLALGRELVRRLGRGAVVLRAPAVEID